MDTEVVGDWFYTFQNEEVEKKTYDDGSNGFRVTGSHTEKAERRFGFCVKPFKGDNYKCVTATFEIKFNTKVPESGFSTNMMDGNGKVYDAWTKHCKPDEWLKVTINHKLEEDR